MSIPSTAQAIAEGERILISQGAGKYTRAAYRIGCRYPRYAGRLLRQAAGRDAIADNARELANVIERPGINSAQLVEIAQESISPTVEATTAGVAATEALETAGAIAFPEIAAVVALGGLALYTYHKMSGFKGVKLPKQNKKGYKSFDPSKIRIGGPDLQHAKQIGKPNRVYKAPKVTQPVASGEIIRGAKIREVSIPNGTRVYGHEVLGTTRAAISTNFTLVGAFVASPLAYPGTRMGIMSKTYAKYNVKKWNIRVITGSPTTTDGQVLTYFHHNRHDPFINWTSTAFITTVLSGQNAVVGPKWTDSYLPVNCARKVLECSFPMGDGHMDLGSGDTLVFTRSSTAHSYIVMCDYEIDFTEPQILSRVNLVPFTRAQWHYVGRNRTSNPFTINTTALDLFSPGSATGNDGTASGFNPVGTEVGDIFRFVCDIDNSSFVNCTPSNLMNHQAPDNLPITLVNGTTIYLVFIGGGAYRYFPTLNTARTFTNPFRVGVTATITVTLVGWLCLVDSMEGTLLQTSV